MDVLQIGVVGCAGRMGRSIFSAIKEDPNSNISTGTEIPESTWIGRDIGEILGEEETGIKIISDPEKLFTLSDVVIDFSSPSTIENHSRLAKKYQKAWILGTTGTDLNQDSFVTIASENCAIVRAANMSLGINLLAELVQRTAATLGVEFDVEILDIHHKNKLDAPSGTALMLGKVIANARKQNHEDVMIFPLDKTKIRPPGSIGYDAIRSGDIVGDHTALFASKDEQIELTHRASARNIFALGAIKAAHWASTKSPGLYGMRDVLGLND